MENAEKKGTMEGPGAPILVQKDAKTKAMFAAFVANKGKDDDAAKHVCMNLEWLGHRRIVLRSNQENAIEELVKEAEKRTAVEIVHKESPVGEAQSNAMVERAVQEVQRQTRIMKSGLERRLGMKLRREHSISTWLVTHAANTINRFRIGVDGKTAYQRVAGKRFERPVVEFGEVVWALRPKSKGTSKWDYRWHEGVWVGAVNKSGAKHHMLELEDGTTRTPHARRRPEGEDRWNMRALDHARGLPWEPIPGKNSVQIVPLQFQAHPP